MFKNEDVNFEVLRQKAFNYRWAEQAHGVIPLTAADPDFPVAPEIVNAINTYAKDGYFSYGPPHGALEFKKAISDYYHRHYQAFVASELVLPVNSAAYGLFVVMKHVLSDKGGNVIIPDPVDFLFRKSVENVGGEVRTCPVVEGTADFDIEKLVNLIDENTRAIMICNPNNPLGLQITARHLEDLIQLAISRDLYIISDEIWADIHFGHATCSLFSDELSFYSKAIIVSGLSKNYGLAGMRIGYIMMRDESIYQSVFHCSGHATTAFGLQGIAQAAGVAALTECDYWLQAFRQHLKDMKQLSTEMLSQSTILSLTNSNATYLLFPKIMDPAISSSTYIEHVMKEAKVALVPGGISWFEKASEGRVRICFATSSAILQEALTRVLAAESNYFK
jgi:aspartate/methionine/tyrosine aminotransferase